MFSRGDSTSLAGLKKQLSVAVPLNVLEKKLKKRDEAHALSVAYLQSAAKVSEERRLETVRLEEEVKTLRKNGEVLRLQLREAVNAHDETAKAARARDLKHEHSCVVLSLRRST